MYFSVFKSQTRHQNGDTHFLTLDEILDETKLLDISMKQKQWLMTEVCYVCVSFVLYSIFLIISSTAVFTIKLTYFYT